MTSSFDDRKRAAETQFKMNEDMRFKINARAVRLFGLWAAKELGYDSARAETYAEEVVDSDFDEPGVQDVFRKVKADFISAGKDVTDAHMEAAFKVQLEAATKALTES